jgi:diamine N-acetyltransferase
MEKANMKKLSRIMLTEVNKDSWEACANLQLSISQGGLVAPNLYLIADSKVEPSFVQLAIYLEKEVIGFAMYGIDPDDGEYWIYRLMIDVDYQSNGYGKEALLDIINRIKTTGAKKVFAGYKPPNTIAASMFAGLGFERTGQMLQGEFIVKLDLENE